MARYQASDFLKLFEARREYCRRLLGLSRQQRDLILADDYTALLSVLGKKQRILGHLEELKELHPRLLERWQVEREHLDPQSRDDCEHVLAETESILSDLVHEENQSTRQLTERRDDTQRQLQALTNASQTQDAYRDAYASSTHRHLDLNM